MADQKISELNAKTTVHADDLFVVVDSEASPDETKKITGENMKAQMVAGLMTSLFTPIAGETLRQSVTSKCPSPFSALINGAPTATSVVYDGETNEACISGIYSGATYWGRIMLYNSTRGTYRKIVSVNINTNTITTESSTDTWANNDSITTQSQVNTTAGYFDVDLSAQIPASATILNLFVWYQDLEAIAFDDSRALLIHPYCTYDVGKRLILHACIIGEASNAQFFLPVISQKITLYYRGTANITFILLTAKGYY